MPIEPLTDCCGSSFAHPDMDICSKCKEHADVYEDNKEEALCQKNQDN